VTAPANDVRPRNNNLRARPSAAHLHQSGSLSALAQNECRGQKIAWQDLGSSSITVRTAPTTIVDDVSYHRPSPRNTGSSGMPMRRISTTLCVVGVLAEQRPFERPAGRLVFRSALLLASGCWRGCSDRIRFAPYSPCSGAVNRHILLIDGPDCLSLGVYKGAVRLTLLGHVGLRISIRLCGRHGTCS